MAFKKGVSGNPSGRPKGAAAIREMIIAKTGGGKKLVDGLLKIAEEADRDSDRVAAYRVLLEYAVGKPIAPVDLNARVTLEDLVVAAGEVAGE